ncbi:MarR family winged helix-turn-helix transcriptional regulator [uncultured Dubosiella sp.]|uniref:MarR family winged helix-turn-helix transcriptional regulator n=1 Tax=uncultured Dubosiella sp. TaxID=1937011 RepID=UPI0025B5600B|nr:hypothetical protein [uncultured Dubosiella sp.]
MSSDTTSIGFAQKVLRDYTQTMKPLAKACGCSSTAVDIILFLGNNPAYTLARDIVVSMNLETMEKEGYVTIQTSARDRRQKEIHLTQKARPILEKGQALQSLFFDRIFAGIDPQDQETFVRVFKTIVDNLDKKSKKIQESGA